MGPYIAELTSATGHAPPAALSSLRRVLLLATIGVVVGGLLSLGVVLTGVFQRSPSGGGVILPSIGPAASQPVQLPNTSGETLTNNPGLAPTITRLEVDGARAFLQWRDPSGGRSEFVVVRVAGSTGTGIGQARPGTTELLVERLDPAQPPYCFLVMAVLGEQRGVSEVRCAEVVPTR